MSIHRAVMDLLARVRAAGEAETVDLPHIVLEIDPQIAQGPPTVFGPFGSGLEAVTYVQGRRAALLVDDPSFADLVFVPLPMLAP